MKKILTILNDWKYIILILIILSGAFYRYDWIPSQKIKYCQSWSMRDEVTNEVRHNREDALYFYGKCLRQYGIDK